MLHLHVGICLLICFMALECCSVAGSPKAWCREFFCGFFFWLLWAFWAPAGRKEVQRVPAQHPKSIAFHKKWERTQEATNHRFHHMRWLPKVASFLKLHIHKSKGLRTQRPTHICPTICSLGLDRAPQEGLGMWVDDLSHIFRTFLWKQVFASQLRWLTKLHPALSGKSASWRFPAWTIDERNGRRTWKYPLCLLEWSAVRSLKLPSREWETDLEELDCVPSLPVHVNEQNHTWARGQASGEDWIRDSLVSTLPFSFSCKTLQELNH